MKSKQSVGIYQDHLLPLAVEIKVSGYGKVKLAIKP